MSSSMDLDAYLQRLGVSGPLPATAQTLAELSVAHAAQVAFENLDPLCGRPVALEMAALQRKIIGAGRGGYCFELNLLFAAALRELGFTVSYLIARVLWTQPDDAITPQTHMLLRVEMDDGSRLVDVGFGGQVLAGALRLEPDTEQMTLLEPFRLLQAGDAWHMQVLIQGQWRNLYRFDLRPVEYIDCVVANHYVSTHPDSRFVRHLMVGRTTAEGRLGMHNHEFTVRRPGREAERRVLADVAEIRAVLEREFLIRLPDWPELDLRLGQLPH